MNKYDAMIMTGVVIEAKNLHEKSVRIWEIKKSFVFAGFDFKFTALSKNHFWGRFGGGWNFYLGIKIGGRTAYIGLGIASLRISRINKESK